MYEFTIQQINGWGTISENLPPELQYSKNYFNSVKDSIAQFVENYSNVSSNYLESYWSNVISQINNIHQFPLTYNFPESD